MCMGRDISNKGSPATEVWRGGAVVGDSARGQLHLCNVVVLCQERRPILGLEGVDVDGAIRGLGGYVFVQRIPSHALYVVVVVGHLSSEGACSSRPSQLWCLSFITKNVKTNL